MKIFVSTKVSRASGKEISARIRLCRVRRKEIFTPITFQRAARMKIFVSRKVSRASGMEIFAGIILFRVRRKEIS